MGRHKGYKHSEATKRKIAMRTKEALSGGVAVAELPERTTAPQAGQGPVAAPSQEGHAAGLAVAVAPKDALDALVIGPLKDVIALMLWKNRHNEPELSVQLTERDLSGFRACVEYLHVTPEVRIVRPQGLPGHGGIPATRTRSAIPPADPTPPKPYVVVALVEKGTDNRIVPVENNEEDWQAAEEAKNFNRARDIALRLAGELQQAAATGNYSSSSLDEAAKCLVALAR
jgi:hypothetical protein